MFFKHYVGYWIQHSKLFLSAYLSCRLCTSKLFLVSIIIKKRWSTILCNIMYMQLLCNILCNKNVHILWASFLFITIITVYYCEVLLLNFCTEFCASMDSNGGKAHVVSYVYVVDKSVLERHILCFFMWIVAGTWKWVPVTPEMLIHWCFDEK
jgi:hypothetical protein